MLEFLVCAPAMIFIPSLDYRKALFSVRVHELLFWFSGSRSRDVPAVESFDSAATGVLCCLVYSQNNFLFLPILVFVPRLLSAHRFGYPQVLTLLS
jgi:hypothetical protein